MTSYIPNVVFLKKKETIDGEENTFMKGKINKYTEYEEIETILIGANLTILLRDYEQIKSINSRGKFMGSIIYRSMTL